MTPDLTPAMPPAETAPDGRAAPEPLRPGAAPPAAPRPRTAAWRVAAAAALVVHLAALYAPRAPDTGGVPLPSWTDLVVHAVIFAALTCTALRARLPVPGAAVIATVLAHAPISELVQHALLAHRSGDVRDVLADAAGVALGWGLARLTSRR